ncbi:MAG: hypothetical protein QXJ30_11170, partial [Metallosphaera sp.]|uniref:hypothetical protein n=1 Tax=Metallosphaera sp. TaxID=2020860 RepID=UPI0031766115
NSVIYNLTAVNATVSLINSQVFHYTLTNSTLLNNTALTPVQILTTSVGHHGVVIPSTVTKNVTSTSAQNGTVIVALVILTFGLILAVYVWRRK